MQSPEVQTDNGENDHLLPPFEGGRGGGDEVVGGAGGGEGDRDGAGFQMPGVQRLFQGVRPCRVWLLEDDLCRCTHRWLGFFRRLHKTCISVEFVTLQKGYTESVYYFL